eukprot:1174898-Amphidinium_carterae.6
MTSGVEKQYQQCIPMPVKHPKLVFEALVRHWIAAFGKPSSTVNGDTSVLFGAFCTAAEHASREEWRSIQVHCSGSSNKLKGDALMDRRIDS